MPSLALLSTPIVQLVIVVLKGVLSYLLITTHINNILRKPF